MPIDYKSWKIIYKMGKIKKFNQGVSVAKKKKEEKKLKNLEKKLEKKI